jgi:hypothetical protein
LDPRLGLRRNGRFILNRSTQRTIGLLISITAINMNTAAHGSVGSVALKINSQNRNTPENTKSAERNQKNLYGRPLSTCSFSISLVFFTPIASFLPVTWFAGLLLVVTQSTPERGSPHEPESDFTGLSGASITMNRDLRPNVRSSLCRLPTSKPEPVKLTWHHGLLQRLPPR